MIKFSIFDISISKSWKIDTYNNLLNEAIYRLLDQPL